MRLKRPTTEELQIAVSPCFTSDARAAAYRRYEAKKWYERIVLQTHVALDLTNLDPQTAAEVAHLRSLVGVVRPPWFPPQVFLPGENQ